MAAQEILMLNGSVGLLRANAADEEQVRRVIAAIHSVNFDGQASLPHTPAAA